MNPTAAPHTLHHPMMDIAKPAPAPAATHLVSTPASAQVSSTTHIVEHIPMHAPSPAVHRTVREDDELETIMKDIGHELKQADRKLPKKRLSLFRRKHHSPAPRPATLSHPVSVAVPAHHPAPASHPAKDALTPRPAIKTHKTSTAPVGIIFLTVLVTGALIAAAIYAYRY